MLEQIKNRIFENSVLISGLLTAPSFCSNIAKITDEAIKTLMKGQRIFFAGNGGSTSQAQHLAAELSGRFLLDRDPLDAICLSDNVSFLTAVSNDYHFEHAFDRALQAHGRKGDLIFLLSTSGQSPNIIKLISKAQVLGIKSIMMTGLNGLDSASKCDYQLVVPSEDTARIQEVHLLAGHIICEIIESSIFSS